MKIAIDVSTALNHGKDIGAGRYIFNLVNNLVELDNRNSYILTARALTGEYENIFEDISGSVNVTRKYFHTTQKGLERWDRFSFPPLEFKGLKTDILHCPDYIIAPTLNRNIVLTIHDLGFIRFPEFNFEWFIEKYTRMVRKNAHAAKMIIADSKSTKSDIMEFFGIDKEKVAVVPLASEPIFRRLKKDRIDKSILARYGIGDSFILSVGTIEPRKNYVSLIKAFDIIKANGFKELKLVIVGRTGWKSEATFTQKDASPYRDDILFLGRIEDTELLQLYNQALLFVYPSIFEGFGLPVLEAMSCGAPVISTDTSSIPEIIDEKKYLVRPDDIKGMADKITEAIDDKELRSQMTGYSLRRSSLFSWSETAKKTLEVYQSL